jgi:chorismate lyase/3-hydroxybenzoate synthase
VNQRAETAGATCPLHTYYLTPAQLETLRQTGTEPLLGEIHFGEGGVPDSRTPHPLARVPMAQCGPTPLIEVWTSQQPVRYGRDEQIVYAVNDEVLFGLIKSDIPVDAAHFEDAVSQLYGSLFRLIETQRYPHLLRMWNYFPDITGECRGLENYQRFCRGRALAFQDKYGEFVYHLPSASALGTRAGMLHIYFIAARTPGVHRENPRQMSAYRYPPQYGPKSPLFARATLKRWGGDELLFISGTASIVGHESRHPGDFDAQLDETLRNIETLVETTRRDEGTQLGRLTDLSHIKVYLRDPGRMAAARRRIEAVAGPQVQVLYLQGDICRTNLLIEIEALARVVAPGPVS